MTNRRNNRTATARVAASPPPAAEPAPPPADAIDAPAPPEPTADQVLGEPLLPLLTLAYTELSVVRQLPEVAPDGQYSTKQVVFAPGTIQQFKDEDRRTMRIVNVGGIPHKVLAPADPAAPPPEGA